MIYVDVSQVITTPYVTGIQRVVLELVQELMTSDAKDSYQLIAQRKGSSLYYKIEPKLFFDKYNNPKILISLEDLTIIKLEECEPNSVFFDIDSVWNIRDNPRSDLYPKLKAEGIKIATYIYDIIPFTFPHLCHRETVFFYLNFLGASLIHSDLIFTSTEDTAKQLNRLASELNIPQKKVHVTGLGVKKFNLLSSNTSIRSEVKKVVQNSDYVLSVGTIEPRKNHLLLLKACEEGFKDLDLKLILVGKSGWNNNNILEKITELSAVGSCVWFNKLNDAEIHYLYANAFCTVIPSYEEGYGLPIIESLLNNTLTFVSDIPVFREVGQNFCDYFSNKKTDELLALISQYRNAPSLFKERKKDISLFKPLSWTEVGSNLNSDLQHLLIKEELTNKPEIKQIFIISNREDLVLNQLYCIEQFMKFITSALICCPTNVARMIKESYKGNLNLLFVFDEDFPDLKMISDHASRNFSLRSEIMKLDILDDVFIMADDDNLPLEEVTIKDFLCDNRYRGYYFFKDISKWTGELWAQTSFDKSIIATAKFLKENDYPLLGFDSHMPQVVDKKIYLEMLERHPELLCKRFSEWSPYFNYLLFHYPNKITTCKYPVLAWPGSERDWTRSVYPTKLKFENFYPSNYQKGAIFEGLDIDFSKDDINVIQEKNTKKISLYQTQLKKSMEWKISLDAYIRKHLKEYKSIPSFGVLFQNGKIVISCPKSIYAVSSSFYRIPLFIKLDPPAINNVYIHYEILDKLNHSRTVRQYFKIESSGLGSLPIYIPKSPGRYLLNITFYNAQLGKDASIELEVINSLPSEAIEEN